MIQAAKRLRRTKTTPIYNIGAVSRLSGLHIWTLRWIEKHGLVAPKRTRGNQRLFSDCDVEQLDMIAQLMAAKVNLAGIRVILRMRAGLASNGQPIAPRSGSEEGSRARAAALT